MKYKLLKALPGAEVGKIIENIALFGNMIDMKEYPDFFEPIKEKKTYDDLVVCDKIYFIDTYGVVDSEKFTGNHCRSETFVTREEAEDEHKRREWSCRKDKFIPAQNEYYFTYSSSMLGFDKLINDYDSFDCLISNQGLAFRTHEECEKAIKEYDLIRLFYTIR